MRIPLSQPDISTEDIDAVVAVLKTPDLSLGPRLASFEAAFAEYAGAGHAVAVSSGTAALHLVMLALEVGPGDEVVTTPFSFIASANCALMAGARPVFADIDPHTWNLDPRAAAAAVTPRTRVLLPVHVFGVPADMPALAALSARCGAELIEDACEALGSQSHGRRAGMWGTAATFAFYPNKQMTTGEGGMVVTPSAAIAARIQSLRNQGRDAMNGWLSHPRMGYNYRLSDIHCALGLSQLARLEGFIRCRRQVAAWYRQRLEGDPRLVLQDAGGAEVSWFVMVVRLNDDYAPRQRDHILSSLRSQGIGCSNYFTPIHLQPFYAEQFGFKPGDFPVCERLAERTLALPFHNRLSEPEVDEVCQALRRLL